MITEQNIEVEIKIPIDNIKNIRDKIKKLDFKIINKKFFEQNIVFDTRYNELKKKSYLLRLRKENKESNLTLKRPSFKSKELKNYKVREEIEVNVSDFQKTKNILMGLGFEIFFIYEKYREVYEKDNVKIMIDQTPIGNFIEIEGDKCGIDKFASLLGFNQREYIVDTYYSLFKKKKIPGFMKFK